MGSSVTDYAGNYIYENGTLQFFAHAEGYVTPDGMGGYDYVYQYKDHLGNIRLSYVDDGNGGLEIVEENNYYPFGLKHKGHNDLPMSSLGNDVAQKWKFGGKEYDDTFDINTYDFGARNYDPALGRWWQVDPLAEEMRRHSPYNFAFNNPLRFIDPDGMSPDDIVLGKDLTEEQRQEILTNLQSLTDDKLTFNSETNKVEIASKGDGSKPSGTDLVRSLIEHENTVTIVADEGLVGSSEESVDKTAASNGEGSDSVVTVGGLHAALVERDGKVSAEMMPAEIALGHELSHSLATMDGVSKPLGDKYRNTFTNRHGETQTETQPKEELYATGIYNRPASSRRSTYPSENSIRAERGQGRRVSYSNGRILSPEERKKRN